MADGSSKAMAAGQHRTAANPLVLRDSGTNGHFAQLRGHGAYLTGLRGVTVFDWPDEREPDLRAFVIAGIRCYEVRVSAAGTTAAHHLRDGEWLPLAAGATVNGAFAAVALHVERVGHLPGWYSAETDAAVRAAAAEILAGAAPFLLAA